MSMIKERLGLLPQPIKEEPDGINIGDAISNFGDRLPGKSSSTKKSKK